MLRRWGIVLVLLNCAELRPVDANTCGNGVREGLEDCDAWVDPALGPGTRCAGADDPARACRFVCRPESCPAGWGCGRDGICRHASGRFEPPISFGLRTKHLSVGDVDGDGRVDLIGSDDRALEVRFGEDGRRFSEGLVQKAPLALGMPAAGRLHDDDERSDVVVPIQTALVVLRGAADRTLQPVAYAQYSLDDNQTAALIPMDVPPLQPGQALLLMQEQEEDLAATVIPIPFPGQSWLAGPISLQGAHGALANLPVPVADLDGDGWSEAVLAPAGSHDVMIVVSDFWGFAPTGTGPDKMIAKVKAALPVGAPVGGGAWIADLDSDGVLDLLVPMQDGTVKSHRGGVFVNETRFSETPLAVDDFDRDGVADVVTKNGIYRSLQSGDPTAVPERIGAPSQKPWKRAITGDFDGDGDADVVGASESLIELVRGLPGGPTTVPLWSSDPTVVLRAGDFNGDETDDVLFGRTLSESEDELLVVFGVTDGAPDAVVSIGRFRTLERVEIGHFRVGNEAFADGAADIVFSSVPHGAKHPTGIVLGSPFDTLYSPLTLQEGNTAGDAPRFSLIGRFAGELDIVVISESSRGRLRWWLVDHETGTVDSMGEIDDSVPDSSRWLAGDVDGDQDDEVVGVRRADGQWVATLLDPQEGSKDDAELADVSDVVDALLLERVDGSSALCVLQKNDLRIFALGELGSVPLGSVPLVGARAIEALQADSDVADELAVLTAMGIVIVDVDSEGMPVERSARVAVEEGWNLLRSADVDGDGLEDIIVADPPSTVQILFAEAARGAP